MQRGQGILLGEVMARYTEGRYVGSSQVQGTGQKNFLSRVYSMYTEAVEL